MSPLMLVVGAFLLGLAAMSFAFGGEAVIVAIPLAVLAIGAIAAFDFSRRRQQAKQVHEETLVSE
jgi:hypothetical protein